MKMFARKGSFLLFLFILSSQLAGKAINKTEAEQAATRFLTSSLERSNLVAAQGTTYSVGSLQALRDPESLETLAYVFTLKPSGFLILSADSDIQPVLAYSFQHDWNTASTTIGALQKLVNKDIQLRKAATGITKLTVEKAEQRWAELLSSETTLSGQTDFRQWPDPGSTTTGGWVETTWLQVSSPYNDFCPDSLLIGSVYGDRGAVGCVATAMAQVVNYHKYIGDLSFGSEDAYVTRAQGIKIDADSAERDFPSFRQLNQYLGVLRTHYQEDTPLTDTDIAALNFACGVAVQMDYDIMGSGAYSNDIALSLLRKFGYASARNIPSADSLYPVLRNNMMNGLPATLSILKSTVCTPGHVIVCDGYNTDGFYHLNFGWGPESPSGVTDAWYFLPEGMPELYDVIVDANVDMRPPAKRMTPLAVSQRIIDLGGAAISTYGQVKSFQLRNSGDVSVTVTGTDYSSYFELSDDSANFSGSLNEFQLNPNEQKKIYVRCLPDSEGLFSGYVIFEVAGGEAAATSVDFKCIGVPDNGTVINAGQAGGVWTKEKSPYYVCGDITMYWPNSLRIEPGVDVIMMGKYQITKEGGNSFVAKGTKEDSIRFFPADTSKGWYGIKLVLGSRTDTLAYCVITGGKSDGASPLNTGGALSIYSSSPVITNCRLSDNFAFNAGAIYITGKSTNGMDRMNPVIKNTLISNNHSTSMGGAVTVSGGFQDLPSNDVLFENVTFANNYTGKMGGALALHMNSHVTLRNCILWGNYADLDGKVIDMGSDNHGIIQPDTLIFEYTDVDTMITDWLLSGNVDGYMQWGEGSLAIDPLFSDAENGDFTLKQTSPCVDAGAPDECYQDPEDMMNPGSASWPAQGTLRNDMGAFGGEGAAATVTGVNEATRIPYAFELKQNYPNPFNPATVIEFSLAQNSRVSMRVFNVLGQVVSTILDNQPYTAGSHRITVDASALANGIYFYKIEAGDFSRVKKMTLLK